MPNKGIEIDPPLDQLALMDTDAQDAFNMEPIALCECDVGHNSDPVGTPVGEAGADPVDVPMIEGPTTTQDTQGLRLDDIL